MPSLLFWLAVGFYGAGTLLLTPSVWRQRGSISPAALGALSSGLMLHGIALALRASELHRLPITDVRSALSFFAFLTTLAFFLVYLRYRIASLGLFMLPLVFVLSLVSAAQPGQSFESESFRSGWLLAHILTILLGYVGFLVTFVAAVMYLIQENELKSKRPRAFYYRLPSLEVCDAIYYRSLLFGLPMLSLGLLLGFVYASRTWKGPWAFDPKILAAMVTWLIYLILFATRVSGSWSGRRAAYLTIFGFVLMMITFVGISVISGPHGYFPTLGSTP
ncbi:MAG: inner membrane protein YpjD [Deltaproteobacteria bacterium]